MKSKLDKREIEEVLDRLEDMYPDAGCELRFDDIFQLLIAVVLSAQTTDKSVNRVTEDLFSVYPDAETLSNAENCDVEDIIKRIGMYRTKAKNIINLSKDLCRKYGGRVPCDYESLISLPGVGRKTANVVLAVGFGEQRIAVDTHVFRVANRIGLAAADNVLKTEEQLMENIPERRWSRTHHSLIFHGRYCCSARNPACSGCGIKDLCLEYLKNNI